jgi:AAA15 family ATPase/GTPase
VSRPSRFEFELYVGGKHYSYGFLASAQRIDAEWLILVDGKEEIELFDRTVAEASPERPLIHVRDTMSTDPNRRQFLRFVAEGTRPNQLFLKELKERNFGELDPVFNWFMCFMVVLPEPNYYLSHLIEQNEDMRAILARFLRDVDTGVSDIGTIRLPTKASEFYKATGATLDNMSFGIAQSGESVVVNESSGDPEIVKFQLQHQGENQNISFDLSEESDGTRRLLILVPFLYVLRIGDKQMSVRVMIDELERSLHPLLASAFVRTFVENASESNGAQLIFTTHDTNLLDQALLPRDSTWFVEKDPQGASKLYSLAEYKSEQFEHLKSLERGYLQGRFGAIPHIRKLGTRGAR